MELVDAEADTSTGTRSRLIRRVVQKLEAEHGVGVVPLPGRTTFYKVIDAVATGRHTFGSAVTRRQTANRPQGMFTRSFAARPGEQVQIDSTPIDVMVLLDNGVPVRADLTIVVDVATRTICAAVLRPVGTKAVDAALLLARMLVPEPMRPGWSQALRTSASVLPHGRLLTIDARMELAAARPVIVPDTDRDRRRESVRLRHLHPRLRPSLRLGAAGPTTNTEGQANRRGDIQLDQHPVLPARRRLHRLLHGMHPREIWDRVSTRGSGTTRRKVATGQLAALTGRPAAHLSLAMPELRDPARTGRHGDTKANRAALAATPATRAER